MKILHTSDWHLGHKLYGYDRTDEFLDFFDQLERILRHHIPDAMLVSGDVFDVPNPPASVARLFTDTILRLHKASPQTTIVVISGNHDSASRIDIDRNLWRANGIYVVGSVLRKDGDYDFSDNIVKIDGKGWITAVPFINRAFLARSENEGETPEKSFFEKAARTLDSLNTDGLPSVLMAHLSVENADRCGHLITSIGGLDAVKTTDFPQSFDYVALGHIHKPQYLSGQHIAYAGSPMSISFDEDYNHSINIVEITKEAPPIITKEIISPIRPLINFPHEATDFKNALKLLKNLPDDWDVYIRLNICQDSPLTADCMHVAVEKCSDKKCRFCVIRQISSSSSSSGAISDIETWTFHELPPLEIAERFFRDSGLDEGTAKKSLSLISGIIDELSAEDSL